MDTQRDWAYYDREFNKNMRSLQDIADEWGTYPNKIRRELIKLGFKPRDHSEAQSAALKSGRHSHPTKGRKRPESVRLRISEGMAENWGSIDLEERQRRSEVAQKQWKDMTKEEKDFFNSQATKALRDSAKNGSILEKFLYSNLRQQGYTLQYHCKHVVEGTKLHVDLLFPTLKTVVEIDGPSHSLPIWGQDSLDKVRESDKKKNDLLVGHGYTVIRLQHLTKNLSEAQKRKYLSALLTKLEEVKVGEANGLIILNIEDKNGQEKNS